MLWIACLLPPHSPPSAQHSSLNERIGQWALQFTPEVCLTQAPHGILLELSRCLRLWGGLTRLKDQLIQGLHQIQATGSPSYLFLARAPTPRAAEWLARHQQLRGRPYPDMAEATNLQESQDLLSRLPIQAIRELECCASFLRSIGIQNLGGILKLPRPGLAQRLGRQGPQVLKAIDQALGYVADPRAALQPQEHFLQWQEFTVPTDSCSLLAQASQPLLHEALGWLKTKQHGLTQARFILRQGRQTSQTLDLYLAQPSQDLSQLKKLWQEKLQHQPLQQTVHSIGLEVISSEPIHSQSSSLFPGPISQSESLQSLAERLYERLGQTSLVQPELQNSHRPEEAMQLKGLGLGAKGARQTNEQKHRDFDLLRPSWLLESPLALKVQNHRPQYQGQALELALGPERIEAEWWSEHPLQRDYFVAQTGQQQMVWVYRTPAHHWFLHGFFG
ncbi:MAG: hypothetical protein ACO326_07150 [Burkholderiaceae bacterium]